jgi:hypothetical protein
VSSIVVLDLVLLVVVVVVVIGQVGVRRTARACRVVARATGLPVPAPRQSLDDRERIEGTLAARLVAGDVSSAAYRQRMAELAAADEASRPLSVPRSRP